MDLGIIYSYTLDADSKITIITGGKTMTREEAKELMPVIKAFAEGKEIQYRNSFNEWIDIKKK